MLLAALALGSALAGGGGGERPIDRFLADLQAADTRGQAGARVWTGRVPAAGDYLIDIVRGAPAGDPVLTYMLTVSVR